MRVSFLVLRAQLLRALAPPLTIAAVAACGSVPPKQPDAGAGGGDDAAVDAAIDAPPIACTETTCSNDVLEVCGSNGMVESTENCALGCFTDGTRCNTVAPSNELASQLDQAAQQGDITLPDGAKINTDTGAVTSANGDTIAVATATVTQSGGPMLRVLIAKSWTINDARVTGTLPVAFVASGEINVRGVLDASADASTGGPGAQLCTNAGAGGAPGVGTYEVIKAGNSGGYPHYVWSINGGGGGGFGSAGGAGGVENGQLAVGAAGAANGQADLIPLRGGCPGYGDIATWKGAGGGAVQLVSAQRIHLVDAGAAKGALHVGGGGAHAGSLGKEDLNDTTPMHGAGGGGSGGAILLEAPEVVLDEGTGLLAAGGGGGGFGACSPEPNGADAPPGAATPVGGSCPSATAPASAGGNGAISGLGSVGGNPSLSEGSGGGGGGGLGRIRVNTADGQYAAGTNSLVRGTASTGMVGRR